MSLPVSREVLIQEVKTAKDVLDLWLHKIEAGIPGDDLPAADIDIDVWVHQLCGELMVVAGKCETLASVIAGSGP
jgi:hypothetical protein